MSASGGRTAGGAGPANAADASAPGPVSARSSRVAANATASANGRPTGATSSGTVVAVDFGATSGRVMLGRVGSGLLHLDAVARFPNNPVHTLDGLHWNVLELYRNALAGIAEAARREPDLLSIGVDSWAVDYGLLHGNRLLGLPYHYRDDRNFPAVDETLSRVGADELYELSGLQHLPFNTVYQLVAEQQGGLLDVADTFLMMPDLIQYWLTGERFAEKTNASTTGLLGVHSREWNDALIERLRLPRRIFAPLIEAGATVGGLLPSVASETGAPGHVAVTAVGSHDTASAIVAVPATQSDFAYISCGTWSLVGVELEHPHVTPAGRDAGFTNEGGVDQRIRYLHNVMGLWLLNESVRSWERRGHHGGQAGGAAGERVDLARLLQQAADVEDPVPTFDVDDARFLPPGDMPSRIEAICVEQGLRPHGSRPEMVRSILQSLAEAYARTIAAASELTGTDIRIVHLVGGGSQNALLCQLTADQTGLPVLAGPVEATALGNVVVQARAQGLVAGDLESLRSLVARTFEPRRFEPRAARPAPPPPRPPSPAASHSPATPTPREVSQIDAKTPK